MPPMFQTLVLSLPTRNSTLRMRVWRALKECGAAVLRDGVYLLPQAQKHSTNWKKKSARTAALR